MSWAVHDALPGGIDIWRVTVTMVSTRSAAKAAAAALDAPPKRPAGISGLEAAIAAAGAKHTLSTRRAVFQTTTAAT